MRQESRERLRCRDWARARRGGEEPSKNQRGVMNKEGTLPGREEERCHELGTQDTISDIQCGFTPPNRTALLFSICPSSTINVNKQPTHPKIKAPVLLQPVFLWAAAMHSQAQLSKVSLA